MSSPENPAVYVAQAVVDYLNSVAFSQSFVATRSYRPATELNNSSMLRVLVVPKGVEYEIASRAVVQDEVQIDVGIHKKVGTLSVEIDRMMGLVMEIVEALRAPELFASHYWVKTENVPIYSPDHLDQANEFLSILTVTFRAQVTR